MMPVFTLASAFVLGAFGWSFAEYALHNWLGHKPKGKREFSREHLAHHADGSYFTPTRTKVPMAAAMIGVLGPLVGFTAGWAVSAAYLVGFVGTYVGYEVLHRRVHVAAPIGRYGRWARKHHLRHHFSSPRHNHGVTSALWDHVFGTHLPPTVVRVPRKQMHAVPWLFDAAGSIKPEYATDYVLVGR